MNGLEISQSNSIKIRTHPGAITESLTDYVRLTARKKTKKPENDGYIHAGTNNITNKVNTLQKIRKVINAIKKNDMNDETEIVLSSDITEMIKMQRMKVMSLTKNLRIYAKGKVSVL